MEKRVFALALALMLCMALLPAALAAEDDGSQSSSLQGEGTEEDPWILTQTGIEKTKVESVGVEYYLLSTNGTYRLGEDITVDKDIRIQDAEVTIDLNGHKLERTAGSGTLLYLMQYLASATVRLTLVDSSTEETGAVRFDSGWVVNLGSNTAFDGTKVPIYGTVKNDGGTISGGTFYGTVINDGGTISDSAKVTVSFASDGGSAVTSQSMLKGQKATRPADPTRDGFCFGGWYEKEDDELKETAFDFSTNITDSVTLYAKWQSHTYEWKTANGQYWQKCKDCGHEAEKKAVPTIVITGADKVCQTQDYTFTVTVPEGATAVTYGYDFANKGDGGLNMTPNNGVYSATIASSIFENESSFDLTVAVTIADGYTVRESKTVQILSEHTGGTATCAEKAKCEVCGQPYGELADHDYEWQTENGRYWQKCKDCGDATEKKAVPTITITGADKARQTEDYSFTITVPDGLNGTVAFWTDGQKRGPITLKSDETGVYSGSILAAVFDELVKAGETGLTLTVYAQTPDSYTAEAVRQVEITLDQTATPTPAPTAAPTAAPSATATPTTKPATAPHTADEANAILWLALAMMSVMGVVVLGRKKEG